MHVMRVAPLLLSVLAICGLVCPNAAARLVKRERASTPSKEVKVGTLAGHGPAFWSGACGEVPDGSWERARCNLDVYEEAAKAANTSGVDMLVLPEFGLSSGGFDGHAEDYPNVGDRTCAYRWSGNPQVYRLSCIAAKYQVALAATVVTTGGHDSKYITLIVFDSAGVVRARYNKNRRFLPAERWATSGGFHPTTFELFGRKWALVIAYEGLFPRVPFVGSWEQFDAFAEQGAENILWSVGDAIHGSILTSQSRNMASRVGMNVFASMVKPTMGGETTALVSPEGRDLPRGRSGVLDKGALEALGYTGSPTIDVASV